MRGPPKTIGFGDDREQRYAQIRAEHNRLCCTGFGEHRTAVKWRGRPEPGMHQESVVDAGMRIDGVDVSGEEHRGLGFAQGDEVSGGQVTQDGTLLATFDERADLRENIVGERVAGMV